MSLLGTLPVEDLLLLAAGLGFAGIISGVLAGLFGVGGGTIIVPVLYQLFVYLDVPAEVRMHLAIGTSLAIIIPTSIRSFRAHWKKGAVDMAVLKIWAVPVVAGVIAGSAIAAFASAAVLKGVLVVIALLNALKLLAGRDDWRIAANLPGRGVMAIYGGVLGLLSALMGIGGGIFGNLVMTLHGRPIHQAVATSSGLGVLISIPGMIGYMIAGWPHLSQLPPLSVGYVSVIGALLVAPLAVLVAPLGVRMAHAFPKRRLEVAFGIFLLVIAARFAWSLFG